MSLIRLENISRRYEMGSETVIAHNVLMSGQQPRHMGWVDEGYRDTGNLVPLTGAPAIAASASLIRSRTPARRPVRRLATLAPKAIRFTLRSPRAIRHAQDAVRPRYSSSTFSCSRV